VLRRELAVQEEDDVDDPSDDQEGTSGVSRAREHDPDDAEEDVDEVVEDADLKNSEQLSARPVPRKREVAVVRREAGNEARDSGRQEREPDEEGHVLQRGALTA